MLAATCDATVARETSAAANMGWPVDRARGLRAPRLRRHRDHAKRGSVSARGLPLCAIGYCELFIGGLACICLAGLSDGLLSIEIDSPNPLHVANCTPVTFVCRLNNGSGTGDDAAAGGASDAPATPLGPVDVYWSFRGENASKLPGTNSSFDGRLASLSITCPERNHSGLYQCLAEEKNTSIIYKKELNFFVYVPVSVEVTADANEPPLHGNVSLTCRVTAWPHGAIYVAWSRQPLPDDPSTSPVPWWRSSEPPAAATESSTTQQSKPPLPPLALTASPNSLNASSQSEPLVSAQPVGFAVGQVRLSGHASNVTTVAVKLQQQQQQQPSLQRTSATLPNASAVAQLAGDQITPTSFIVRDTSPVVGADENLEVSSLATPAAPVSSATLAATDANSAVVERAASRATSVAAPEASTAPAAGGPLTPALVATLTPTPVAIDASVRSTRAHLRPAEPPDVGTPTTQEPIRLAASSDSAVRQLTSKEAFGRRRHSREADLGASERPAAADVGSRAGSQPVLPQSAVATAGATAVALRSTATPAAAASAAVVGFLHSASTETAAITPATTAKSLGRPQDAAQTLSPSVSPTAAGWSPFASPRAAGEEEKHVIAAPTRDPASKFAPSSSATSIDEAASTPAQPSLPLSGADSGHQQQSQVAHEAATTTPALPTPSVEQKAKTDPLTGATGSTSVVTAPAAAAALTQSLPPATAFNGSSSTQLFSAAVNGSSTSPDTKPTQTTTSDQPGPAAAPAADATLRQHRHVVDLTGDSHARIVVPTRHNVTGRPVNEESDDEVTSWSQLILEDLSREQNATYFCYAFNADNNMTAMSSHHVQVIEPPEVDLTTASAEDSRTVRLRWSVRRPRNQPVARYHLQVKNYSAEVDWLDVHNAIPANSTAYTVGYLAPGVTYGFRVAGVNDLGVGEWATRNVTLPPDVPPKINQVHLLATTNNTLVFAWQRPPHNNGATISQYNFELLKLREQQLYENRTMLSNENSTRSNYMFVYVGLTPGDSYAFQVRACNAIGCGNWSDQLEANTSDGTAGAPQDVRVRCFSNEDNNVTYTLVTWRPPVEARGTIQGYNITLDGSAFYRRENGALENETYTEAHEVNATTTQFQVAVRPHTNYTVRVCTINRAGCGNISGVTSRSTCISPPIVPPPLPQFALERSDHDKQLRLRMVRVSERVADILCYRVILIKLPTGDIFRLLPRDPTELNVTSWEVAHRPDTHIGAYVAEAIPSEELPEEVVLGDLQGFHCDSALLAQRPPRLRGLSGRQPLNATRRTAPSAASSVGAGDAGVQTAASSGSVAGRAETRSQGLLVADRDEPRRLKTIEDITSRWPRNAADHQERQLERAQARLSRRDTARSNAHRQHQQPAVVRRDQPLAAGPDAKPQHTYQSREIYDGLLSSHTNYTGYVEIEALGVNGTVVSRQSGYFPPIETDAERTAVVHESPVVLLAALLSGFVLIVLMLFVLACLIRKKSLKLYTDPASVKEPPPTSVIIKAHNLPAAFIKKHADNDHLFQNEFDMLPDKFKDRTTYASDAPENAHKNRYPDVKAYDQTRVKLTPLDGLPGSDYINANVVEGWRNKKTYVCAQGPTDRTLHDFWRMIWEQGITVVLMLTGTEEHGKSKCAQYWADLGAKEIESEFIVGVLAVRYYADFCVRKFIVNRIAGGITEEREILQFHYTMWKDFVAPEQPAWMLRFVKRVNEHYVPDRGPLLVHCSAGVGRTGTFVAVDMLRDHLDNGDDHVDVFSCVSFLRHQRMHLVQTTKQYIFIYRALMEYVQFGDTEIEIGHLRDHYLQLKEKTNLDGKDGLALEFEKLNEVIEDPKSCLVGQMEANQAKNRYNFILPYDINRGYDRSQSFIVTQDPLDATVADFWRMVNEQGVSTIVMLSELGCSPSQTKCHPYWPVNSELICDYVTVKFLCEQANDFYIRRDFEIVNTKSLESHRITQLQHKGWVGQIEQDSCISVLAVIDAALMSQASVRMGICPTAASGVPMPVTTMMMPLIGPVGVPDPAGPICVHCSGGGDRSSVFVTLFELVQQLRSDERVDVFQAARFTRSQRPCTLQTANQYEFLYRGLLTYIETHQLCDMADTQL